ncbi:lytic murein transglycosylase [Halovulum sp. GXIMD14793]
MPRPSEPLIVAQNSTFQAWKTRFRAKALRAGIKANVFDAAFRDAKINQDVLRLSATQPEFVKPIWEYLDSAVSSDRVTNGRQNANQLQRTLAAIEKTYGVDAEAIVAIWGIETNYGSYRGNISTIDALATLAYAGKDRRKFGEDQLMAALKIIQSGEVHPSQMNGSWAGAMGHTQFIPTSYLSFAQDFTRDGRRNVWGEDPTDALASTANYLRQHGWTKNQPWGIEVALPAGFNYAYADGDTRRSVKDWSKLGLRQANGQALRDFGPAALLAPAGARGPVFLTFDNFNVIKKYNNATSYAVAVGHLAQRIAGAPDFRAKWPRQDRTLSRTEKLEMQRLLTRKGFSTGGLDGKIGPKTMDAIRAYQKSQGLVADGYASEGLLLRLRG